MRLFALLLLSACVPLAPSDADATADGGAPDAAVLDDAAVELGVIGTADGGAVVVVSVTASGTVALDPDRPARLTVDGRTVEASPTGPPTTRQLDGRTVAGASFRVDAATAQALARGGDVPVELSVGGAYRSFQARRSDMLN